MHQNAHGDVGRFPFILSSNRNLGASLKGYLNF